LAFLGFIHGNSAPVELRTVHLVDRALCRIILDESDEPKTARASGLGISDDHRVLDFAETLEGGAKRPCVCTPAEASDEHFLCHLSLYLSKLGRRNADELG
jgi:hypothetical protein